MNLDRQNTCCMILVYDFCDRFVLILQVVLRNIIMNTIAKKPISSGIFATIPKFLCNKPRFTLNQIGIMYT